MTGSSVLHRKWGSSETRERVPSIPIGCDPAGAGCGQVIIGPSFKSRIHLGKSHESGRQRRRTVLEHSESSARNGPILRFGDEQVMRVLDHQMFSPSQCAGEALANLMLAQPIKDVAVVVTAHPDDETLAMGGRLSTFKSLRIVQLTDGAPICDADARRAGFSRRESYAAAREAEALNALAALRLNCRRIRGGAPDQESIFFVPQLLGILERELKRATLVFTHPYEGGHPDHDTAALLVQLACDLIRANGGAAPARLEFASYHHSSGELVAGHFWSDPTCPEITVSLSTSAAKTKCEALAEYRTQEAIIGWFQHSQEHYRAAPRYDFVRPPPPGFAHYDLFGWPMTAGRWRGLAARHTMAKRS